MDLKTPKAWLNWFLNRKDLLAPDGRILFKYRINSFEFDILKKILESSRGNIEGWNACFVLYASEYWRRYYTEGAWSWDFITDSLANLNSTSIQNVKERSEIIETGIRYWKRDVYKNANGHNGYLSTIILECGLPEGILAKSAHWLTQAIVSAYEELRTISISELEPREIVQHIVEQKEQFPDSLKKEEIYELIAQITQEAIDLKRRYQLENKSSPTNFLQTANPDWKASFPIQISSVTATFLDQLLTEVAKLPEPKKYNISLRRELLQVDTIWVINAFLEFPDGFYDYQDLHLVEHEQELLDPVSNIEIELVSPDDGGNIKKVHTGFKTQKNGKEGFSIKGIDNYPVGKNAGLHSWELKCSNYEHDVSVELPFPGGEALDDDLPWAFEEKNGSKLFKGTGSVSVKAHTIYVVADNSWAKNGSYQSVGILSGGKKIYRVTGECSITADN